LAKPEWGLKRTCPTCGARFYDLRRETIVCPVCDTAYNPERLPKPKRGGPIAREEKAPAPARRPVPADDEEETIEEDVGDVELDDSGEDDAETEEGDLVEDASDLGEDDDDIGEVMEHVDEDEDKP
jgi:uncharacterized protein (TIGR02300 family)